MFFTDNTRKIYFKDKAIWKVEVVLFRYKQRKTPHLEPQKEFEMMLKQSSVFLQYLQVRPS